MIYGIHHPLYSAKHEAMGPNRYNGAYYYAKEIEEIIIPRVETSRNWVLLNHIGCEDHSIVFIHNNLRPERYEWLRQYNDLILVCGIPETCEKVKHLGRAVYLPLSVDISEVEKYTKPKSGELCFFGRKSKGSEISNTVPKVTGMNREQALQFVARYRKCYAVGRCAIEAKILGCEIIPYDKRFQDPDLWKVIDNREAADMLQDML